MPLPTRYWQPPRLRQHGRRWIMLKHVGLASLLLGGSTLTARHTRADDIEWTLGSNGSWDVADNWTVFPPPPDGTPTRVPNFNDDAVNLSGFLISLAGSGEANSFTTNGDFNLTGTLYLNSKLAQSGSSVFTINGGTLQFAGSASQIISGNITLNSGFIGADTYNHTLTIDHNTLIHGGGNGYIAYVGTYDGEYGGSLVNNGTISADVSGQTLSVQPGFGFDPVTSNFIEGSLTSTGTLQALNGGTLYVNNYGGGTIGGQITANGSGSIVNLNGDGNFADATTIQASNSGLVYLAGDYDNQNHSLTIADGSLSMYGGTLRNSTVNLSGGGLGLDFSTGNGTLDNVTINGALNVTTNTAFIYSNFTVTNGITLNGGHVQFQTDNTLHNGNVINNGGYVGGMEGTTLTLDSSTLVHGGSNGYVGAVYYDSLYGVYRGGNLVNNGMISADVSGQALSVQPGYGSDPNTNISQYGSFDNTGTLQALNGGTLYVNPNGNTGGTIGGNVIADGSGSIVNLGGTSNFADATTIKASSGGLVYLSGTYDNQNHSLKVTDGTLSMLNGTLLNSTVDGAGVDFLNGDGTLTNVTLNSNLYVPANSATLDNVTINGNFAVNGGTANLLIDPTLNGNTVTGNFSVSNDGYAIISANSFFHLTGTTTLDGGHIEFLSPTLYTVSPIFTNNGGYIGTDAPGNTLTLDSGVLIHGGNVYVGTYDGTYGGSLVNNGTISADVSGQALYAQAGQDFDTSRYGTFDNTGTLQALNGGTLYVNQNGSSGGTVGGSIIANGSGSVVNLGGTEKFADATTITASSGGLVYLSGVYDNQNHSITIADGALSFNAGFLQNSTVNVSGTGTGLDFSAGDGVLGNVIVNGAINVTNHTATIFSDLTATSITLDNGRLLFAPDFPLSSSNVSLLTSSNVTMNGGSISIDQPIHTLILDSSTLVHGGNNGLIGSYLYTTNFTGYIGGDLVNNGTISADVNGQALYVQPGALPTYGVYSAVTNTGILEAKNGGTLQVNYYGGSGTSTGTIQADPNSTVSLNNVTQTAGQTIANGTIVTNNSFTLKGGSFIGEGAVTGPLANTDATVSPGTLTTAGHLTVNGDYSQDASSQLLIKLGGTIQGTNFDLLSVANTATLHGTLDVQLINNFVPTAGETFDFLTYQSRIGDFDSLVSLNGGYTYSVTYNDASGIGTIHVNPLAVPEAGTVVSLSILLLGTGCVLRRTRRQSEDQPRSLAPRPSA